MDLFLEILKSKPFVLCASFILLNLLILLATSIISFLSNIDKHAKRSIIKLILKKGLANVNETFNINLKEKTGNTIKWEVSVGEKSHLITTWFTFIKKYEKAI